MAYQINGPLKYRKSHLNERSEIDWANKLVVSLNMAKISITQISQGTYFFSKRCMLSHSTSFSLFCPSFCLFHTFFYFFTLSFFYFIYYILSFKFPISLVVSLSLSLSLCLSVSLLFFVAFFSWSIQSQKLSSLHRPIWKKSGIMLIIYRRFSIRSCDSLSLAIPNNKMLEYWGL